MKVYPNPVQDKLYISNLNGTTIITISDIMGRMVKKVISYDHSLVLDLSSLESGMYILDTDGDKKSLLLLKE